MEQFITNFISNYGYLAICLLICVENVFPPIPSEVILIFGGFYVGIGHLNIVVTILIATLGSVLGAIVLYGAGRWFGKERVFKILKGKVGKLLFLKPENVEKADAAFVKHQQKAVFICRCIPIVRSLISIPAGIEKMNFAKFLLLTFIGSTLWNTLLVVIGVLTKDAWQEAVKMFEHYSDIFLIALIVLIILYFVIRSLIKRRKQKKNV